MIRAIDSDGDWVFGQGLGSYLTGQAAIVQDIQTALQFFQNDCFWNETFGVDWWNLLGQFGKAVENTIILQVRNVISNIAGVVSINSVTAVWNTSTRSLLIQWNVNTVFSQASGTTQIPS